jgi:hypothetical protein
LSISITSKLFDEKPIGCWTFYFMASTIPEN